MQQKLMIEDLQQQAWYDVNGYLHRLDGGPAVIRANGYQEWRVDGKLHRLDGPAVIWENGTQEWWINHKLHRLDGPAIIRAAGTQEWWINDKRHRINGPAIIYANGIYHWWVNGKNITNDVEEWMHKNKITYPFNNESLVLFKLMFC